MKHLVLPLCTLLLAALTSAQDVRYNDFLSSLSKAIEYADESGVDKAMRGDADMALRHFGYMLWQNRNRPDPNAKKMVEAMKASWERAYKTRTLEHYERYVSSRSEQQYKDIVVAENTEREIWDIFGEAQKNKDRGSYVSAAQGAENLAKAYDTMGHALHAAKMWSLASQITNVMPDKSREDKQRALAYLENFMARREQWEWTKDSSYLNNGNWIKSQRAALEDASKKAVKREAEGYDADVDGVEGMVLPKVPAKTYDLTFEQLKTPNLDMFAKGGTAPGQWMLVEVKERGPNKIPFFTRRDVFLVRPAGNKLGFSIDGSTADLAKGQFDPVVPSAKFKASLVHLGPNQTEPYAMWFYMSEELDVANGITAGMGTNDPKARVLVYYKSASSWVATIDDETVTFYDDNSNGKLFEKNPLEYDLRDRTREDHVDGVKIPAFDSMKIGKGPPTPLSSFAKIGETWYNLRGSEGGDKVIVRPCNPEYFKTGTVELKWKGSRAAKPEVLILSGKGTFAGAHYNIASTKSVEVPVGEYLVSFGRIVQGEGVRGIHAQVFNGDLEPVVVEEGKTTTLTLGAPFTLDFVKGGDKFNIEIDAMSIVVKGVSGERYARITLPPTPEVIVASKPGKGGKPVGSFVIMSADNYTKAYEKFPNLNVDLCFFPLPKGEVEGKFVFKAKNPVPGGYVGLRETKHKLFGKMDPIWKQ